MKIKQKILTLSIITYNRPNEIRRLYDNFLDEALSKYGELIDVRIFDNSDEKIQIENSKFLHTKKIQHIKNKKNLGYSGNFIKSSKETRSKYNWIMSDNDTYHINEFPYLIHTLQKEVESETLRPIILQYQLTNNGSPGKIENQINWKPVEKLSNSKLPFVYLSCVVYPVADTYAELDEAFSKNDFIQIIFYLNNIEYMDTLLLERVIISYNVELLGRFKIVGTYNSLKQISDYLDGLHGFKKNTFMKNERKNLIRQLILHYSHLIIIADSNEVEKLLVREISNKWQLIILFTMRKSKKLMPVIFPAILSCYHFLKSGSNPLVSFLKYKQTQNYLTSQR